MFVFILIGFMMIYATTAGAFVLYQPIHNIVCIFVGGSSHMLFWGLDFNVLISLIFSFIISFFIFYVVFWAVTKVINLFDN